MWICNFFLNFYGYDYYYHLCAHQIGKWINYQRLSVKQPSEWIIDKKSTGVLIAQENEISIPVFLY